MRNRVGQRAPAHLTGCGKSALSRLSFSDVESGIRRFCADERCELPDLAALEDELGNARRVGYVVSRTYQRNHTSIAAPILDADQRPVGGVSVAGPTPMFTNHLLAAARESITDAATMISSRLVCGPR
jgi:DNA-binding IclR family transcriptional regulator